MDFFDDVQHVAAGLAFDEDRHRRATLALVEMGRLFQGQFDACHVRNANRAAAGIVFDDRVAQRLQRIVLSEHAKTHVLATVYQVAGRSVDIVEPQSRIQLGNGDAASGQGLGVETNLDLVFAAAFDVDLRHAFDSLQARFQITVGVVVERGNLEFGIVGLQQEVGNRVVAGRIGHVDNRSIDILRILGDFVDLVRHLLQDAFGRSADVELERDGGPAQLGFATSSSIAPEPT